MSRIGGMFWFLAGLSLVIFAVTRFLIGMMPFLWILLALAGILAVLAVGWDWRFYWDFLNLKTTKRGLNMGTTLLLFIVVLVSLNIIGQRYYKTFDLSPNQINSLSEQSRKVVKDLKDDLVVTYFYQENAEGVVQNKRGFIDLLRKYQDINPRIRLEFVEVNKRPDLAKKYDIVRGQQTVVVEYQGRRAQIEKIDEQELTSAIVKVTQAKDRKIYFLKGHGEVPLEKTADGRSLSAFKELLTKNRYIVQEFSFLDQKTLPSDADVVVIWGPQRQFLDFEVDEVIKYLQQGGKLLLGLKAQKPHQLGRLLSWLHIKPSDQFVVTLFDTPFGKAIDPRFTRGSEFDESHPIVKPFPKGEFVLFQLPQYFTESDQKPEGWTFTRLVATNRQAIAVKDLDSLESIGPKTPKDSYVLGWVVEGTAESSSRPFKAVILGDDVVFTNGYLYLNLNRDLALNAVSWMADAESLVAIAPREVGSTQLDLTPTGFMVWVLTLVLPLPLLFYIGAAVQWWRLRHA